MHRNLGFDSITLMAVVTNQSWRPKFLCLKKNPLYQMLDWVALFMCLLVGCLT